MCSFRKHEALSPSESMLHIFELIALEIWKKTNVLPDCEVGIHGNQGLKAHCSARDNSRDESSAIGLLENKGRQNVFLFGQNMCEDKKVNWRAHNGEFSTHKALFAKIRQTFT